MLKLIMITVLVLDTNVWISGILFKGSPYRVVRRIREGRALAVCSDALYAEFHRVAHSRKVRHILQPRFQTPESLIAVHRQLTVPVFPLAPPAPPPGLRDMDDLAVLACASTRGVSAILTGDKDLLVLESYQSIPILTPRQWLDQEGDPGP